MTFVTAQCPSCGGELKLDNTRTEGFCMYCGNEVVVEEAIEKYKIEVSGKVSVEGLATVKNLLLRGNQCLEGRTFEKAEEFFE